MKLQGVRPRINEVVLAYEDLVTATAQITRNNAAQTLAKPGVYHEEDY